MFTGPRKPRGPKTWRYSMDEIANGCGRTGRQVREDIRNRVFDPGNLMEVVRYMAGYIWRNMK